MLKMLLKISQVGKNSMRKIPIYDTSSSAGVKELLAEWDGHYLSLEEYGRYTEAICAAAGARPEQCLEVSKQSIHEFGKELRMASLMVGKGESDFSCESIYQGSKVLNRSGNRHWLYEKPGEFSLREKSKRKNETIVSIDFFGFLFSVDSLSELHDIVYWLGLEYTFPNLEKTLSILDTHEIYYFTDCFDSPGKNSQSKSFSSYYWGWKNDESVWDNLTDNQKRFLEIIKNNSFEKSEYVTRKNAVMKSLF